MENNKSKSASGNSINNYICAIFMGLFVGGIFGGLCGIFLPGIYYSLVNPDVLKDGQFGLIYLLSLPMGALIGAVLGIAFLCFTTAKMHASDD